MNAVVTRMNTRMNANSFAYIFFAVLMIGDGVGYTKAKESHQRWKRSAVLSFNDPGYPKQFYLNDEYGVTMNIRKAWANGYTGKNVTICIHDHSGIYYKHDDFKQRFKMAGSYNFDNNNTDPSPPVGSNIPFGNEAHGSAMGGVAAGQANNGKCGVGVAYDAYITGIRTPLDSKQFDKIVADSLAFGNQISDIYSCSWTPINFFADNVGNVPPEAKVSMKNGAEKGRGGKGNIYVFGNGNGGNLIINETCGYNEYISSIYTMSISVATGRNTMSRQNVECTGVSAVTYARDGSDGLQDQKYVMPTCKNDNKCMDTTASSSAATAVASGIFALLLQANPNLGWRDVQHLVARTSSTAFPSVTWKTNKAGVKVSDGFGFGLLDADALIENAKGWTNVGRHLECVVDYRLNETIDGVNTTVKSINLTAWPASCGGESQRINFLEHVLLVVSFNYTLRFLVEIEIEAPTGTKSIILRSGRQRDAGQEVKDLSILSLHHWGENPNGIWTMRLRNVEPSPNYSGSLYRWGFQFYGTKDDPLASNTIKPSQIGPNSTNATSRPPVTRKNTGSQSTSGTSPTVSGIWTKPNAITVTINGTTGTTRKVPTITKNGSGSLLKSCKSTYLAAAFLVLSLLWKIN